MWMRISAIASGLVTIAAFSISSPGQAAGPASTPRLPQSATRAGIAVLGSVVDESLAPIDGVAISVSGQAGVAGQTTSRADGTYEVAGLTAGTFQVRAEKAGFIRLERSLRLAAGSGQVTLPLVLVRVGHAATTQPVGVVAEPAAANAGGAKVGAGGRQGFAHVGAALPLPTAAPVAAPPAPPSSGERSFAVDASRVTRLPSPQQGMSMPSANERYAHVDANRFQRTLDHPLSTFGADVDTASFTNVRRFIQGGQLPPADAVRLEEFVNYFHFDYGQPVGPHPIALTTEVADCPWAPTHKLVLIGARAGYRDRRAIDGRNIVLLIDVSGSMSSADKLPLLKSGLSLFVDSLDPSDRLSLVTYAGTTGVVLPPTLARERGRILDAIGQLGAGGSTNGGQGLITAYRVARESYMPGGVNRVILATDGDFNVGIVSQQDLLRLIEREKRSGIFLSVFGVGTGNLQDSTMEMLADHGNGHYAYLDSLQEARRVLVREADATLETVAKEVKFQVEFNPARVAAWKQLGYENRMLAAEDFNDDRKDGGEIGAGESVTVLYEIVPAGLGDDGAPVPGVDPLKYQPSVQPTPTTRVPSSDEWLTVKVRYQWPAGEESRLLVQPVAGATTRPRHLPFAATVAEFALLLRDANAPVVRWDSLERRVTAINREAPSAEREAFGELVALARGLSRVR